MNPFIFQNIFIYLVRKKTEDNKISCDCILRIRYLRNGTNDRWVEFYALIFSSIKNNVILSTYSEIFRHSISKIDDKLGNRREHHQLNIEHL